MNERWLYTHLALLARNAVWLCLAGALSAVVALAVLLSQPRTYLASVDVVPSRARTVVNLDTNSLSRK